MIKNRLSVSMMLLSSAIALTACSVGSSLDPLPNKGETFAGPLRVSERNPRYFADDSGRAIYLTGSHTWANLLDKGTTDPPSAFDYNAYLDFLKAHNHNFIRLWTWELSKYTANSDGSFIYAVPLPWSRTGPGVALDGKPKFDLTELNQAYFDRMRSRIIAAGAQGIYVSIMLFEGWGMSSVQSSWRWDGHPFNAANNINGVDGDPNKDGKGLESHTLQIPSIVKVQEDYVRKVVDTVNDLDNVLYEISNEDHRDSIDWQYHLINFIRHYEATKPKQHPIGMTTHNELGNEAVFRSNADFVSPAVTIWGNNEDPYKMSPPATDGGKVILLDTDHLWGMGGDRVWVWKSFLRGYNPIYMDNLDSDRTREEARKAMGHTSVYAAKLDLRNVTPRNDLASTAYCLARPGSTYLIYQPETNAAFTVELTAGTYNYEWFNPASGTVASRGTFITEGGNRSFISPFVFGDAVLYLSSGSVPE